MTLRASTSAVLRLATVSLVATLVAGCDTPSHPNSVEIADAQATPLSYPYRFVVMGDNRIPGLGVFEGILDQVTALDPAPVFSVDIGDMVLTGSQPEYTTLVEILDGHTLPFVAGIGNHEQYYPTGEATYGQVFGDEDFFFDYGLSRFIYLDNSNPGGYGLTAAQLAWLETALDDPAHPDRYVFMHVPPTLPGASASTSAEREDIPGDDVYTPLRHGVLSGVGAYAAWPELVNLLEAYQVRVAFFGHIHDYEHSFSSGVHYVITGGAGAEIGLPEDSPPDYGVFHHFLVVEVGADGQSRVDLIKAGAGTTPSTEYSFEFSTTPVS